MKSVVTYVLLFAAAASAIVVPDVDAELVKRTSSSNCNSKSCSGNTVPGLSTYKQGSIRYTVCECVSSRLKRSNNLVSQSKCPSCPANSSPSCDGGKCGCDCDDGYQLTNGVCKKKQTPQEICVNSNGTWKSNKCVCTSPYKDDGKGGCTYSPELYCTKNNGQWKSNKCVCTSPYKDDDKGGCTFCPDEYCKKTGGDWDSKKNKCTCKSPYKDDGKGGCTFCPDEYCKKTGGEWNSKKNKCVCKNPYKDDGKGGCTFCPDEYCKKTGGVWDPKKNKCTCKSPYKDDGKGGCTLPASPKCRTKKSQIQLLDPEAALCPAGEKACPVGNGYECLDVTQSLESCGGCVGNGGVNCLEIEGIENVVCRDSACVVTSCRFGWKHQDGECVPATLA